MQIVVFILLMAAALLGPSPQNSYTNSESSRQVVVGEHETVVLPYDPRVLTPDFESEEKMFLLVNEERRKAGLDELELDPEITEVARAHSLDMWQKKYFAHESLDGQDPAERLQEGEVVFMEAGENLALARNIERAHRGLMNSEGHRRNILDPNFRRIGIGVIDGGKYGKMFTQNFAD